MKCLFAAWTLSTALVFIWSPGLAQVAEDIPPKRAQSIYGELGGNGLLFSANYDFRFNPSQKGLGMRVGLGFFGGSGGGILTVPVGINFLRGREVHFFETGLGFTYASFTGSGDDFFSSGGSLLVPSIGYRYQSNGEGFIGRVILSPLINLGYGGGWIMFGGISAGYKIQ